MVTAIGALAESYDNRYRFGDTKTCEVIIDILCHYYSSNERIATVCFIAMANLCVNHDGNKTRFGTSKCCEALVQALQIHQSNIMSK